MYMYMVGTVLVRSNTVHGQQGYQLMPEVCPVSSGLLLKDYFKNQSGF